MVIESDPPGARCYIDNRYAGETPVEIPFTFYGTREIVLRRDKYRSHRVMESMNPPWYGYIPFDFFVENLWPGEVIDRREFSYMLEPFALPGGEERDEMLEELRRRAEDLRTEEEKPENDEPSGAGEAEQENSRKAEQ